jgi:hypothetical protein
MTGLESTKLPEPKGAHGKDGVTRRGRGSGACRLVAMGPSTGPRDAGNPVVVTQWAGSNRSDGGPYPTCSDAPGQHRL